MLGSFWSSKQRDAGEVTPKASSHPERNPFELSLGSSGSGSGSSGSNAGSLRTGGQHSRKNSAASTSSNVGLGGGGIAAASGLRTPTLQKSFVLPEVTSSVNAHGSHMHPSSSTSAASSLHQSPVHTVAGNGRHTPTRAHHPVNPYPAPGSPKVSGMSGPTSSLGKSSQSQSAAASQQPQPQTQQPPPPEFKLSQPPESKHGISPKKDPAAAPSSQPPTTSSSNVSSSSSSQGSAKLPPSATGSSTKISPSSVTGQPSKKKVDTSYLKGKLTVKILEARGLAAPSSQCRPYVVATFEQNEFVSREAINENEEDATGQPMSPESSSQLRRSQKAGQAPSNNNSNNSQREEPMDTSTASAYNPVWKHEVALFVLLPCR